LPLNFAAKSDLYFDPGTSSHKAFRKVRRVFGDLNINPIPFPCRTFRASLARPFF